MPASWFDSVTITVEFGWGADMTADSISWTDETARVRNIDIRRGRGTEFDFMPAGELRLILNNADGRFDPLNSGGDLYGDLSPGTQVRVRYTHSATTYDLFRGRVESLQQGWHRDTPSYASCAVIASDARAYLSTRTLRDCPLAVEIAKDEPLHWWRLGEQEGTSARDSGSGGAHGTHSGLGSYNYRQGLALSCVDGAIEFMSETFDHIALPSLTLTPPFTVTAQLVIRTAGKANPIMRVTGSGDAFFTFAVNSSDQLTCGYNDGTDERTAVADTTTLAADTTYTVSCVILPSADPKLYLDTVLVDVTADGTGTLGAITGTGYLGRHPTAGYADIVLDEVTVFASDKEDEAGATGGASTRLDDFFDARRDAWDEDTWGGDLSRVEKVLASVGWPSDRHSVTDYTTRLVFGPADLGENNAAAYLDDVANSEGGYWFVGADGKVYGHDHYARANLATSTSAQATLSDDPDDDLRPEGLSTDGTSLQWIRNVVRQRRPYGSVQEARDDTSVTAYGELMDDLGSSMLRTDADVATRVAARLAGRKDAKQRFTSAMWSPRRKPATYPKAALEVGNRVTVKRTPPGGVEYTQDCFIEGIEHQISQSSGQWMVTWRLSPA